MSPAALILLLLGLGAVGFVLGRQRALAATGGDPRGLHSLPAAYGQSVALFTVMPALALMLGWLLVQPVLVESRVAPIILPSDVAEGSTLELALADMRRIAGGWT